MAGFENGRHMKRSARVETRSADIRKGPFAKQLHFRIAGEIIAVAREGAYCFRRRHVHDLVGIFIVVGVCHKQVLALGQPGLYMQLSMLLVHSDYRTHIEKSGNRAGKIGLVFKAQTVKLYRFPGRDEDLEA